MISAAVADTSVSTSTLLAALSKKRFPMTLGAAADAPDAIGTAVARPTSASRVSCCYVDLHGHQPDDDECVCVL